MGNCRESHRDNYHCTVLNIIYTLHLLSYIYILHGKVITRIIIFDVSHHSVILHIVIYSELNTAYFAY